LRSREQVKAVEDMQLGFITCYFDSDLDSFRFILGLDLGDALLFVFRIGCLTGSIFKIDGSALHRMTSVGLIGFVDDGCSDGAL